MEQPFSAKICLTTEQSEHPSPCLPWQLPSPPVLSLPSPSHLCSTGPASITKADAALGADTVPRGLQGWRVPHVTGMRAAAASCNSSKAWGSDAAPLPPLPWPGARALAPCLVAQQLLLAQGRRSTLCRVTPIGLHPPLKPPLHAGYRDSSRCPHNALCTTSRDVTDPLLQ